MKTLINRFISNFLCSFSQIMLQKSTITGLLFALGIGLNAPIMLIGASVAIMSALLCVQLFQYCTDTSNDSIYGYNAALVGLAIFYFLPPTVFSFTLTIFAGAFSSMVMRLWLQKLTNLPAFTSPFIVTTWLLLLLFEVLAINVEMPSFTDKTSGDFYVVMRGVAQVMFQEHWLSGAVFSLGLLLHSIKVATWAVIGSVSGLIIARALHFSEDLVVMGLYGFNASLTAIALSSREIKKLWSILLGITISILLTKAFEYTAIPALTAPFVLASWIVIVVIRADSDENLYCINQK